MPKRGYHHGNLRQALVDAALELITIKGPTGFTLSEAAKQAGVTPAAVYRHFEGREDLIAEAALQGYAIFGDLMQYAFEKVSRLHWQHLRPQVAPISRLHGNTPATTLQCLKAASR